MQRLEQQVSELATAVVLANAGDVDALARLLRRFRALSGAAAAVPESRRPIVSAVRRAATKADEMLGRLLKEQDDPQSVLRKVTALVERLQEAISRSALPKRRGRDTGRKTAANAGKRRRPGSGGGAADPPAPAAGPLIQPDDLPLVQEFISEAREHVAAAESGLLRLEENPDDSNAVNAVFRSFHTIKGVAAFLNLHGIASLAHAAEHLLDKARRSTVRVTGPVADVTLEAVDNTRSMVDALEEAARHGTPAASPPGLPDLIRRLECGGDERTEGGDSRLAANPGVSAVQPAVLPRSAAPSYTGNAAAAEATVRVATDRLDSLVDAVGELVIAQSVVAREATSGSREKQRLAQKLSHLAKVTRELQDLSMSLRMVPVEIVFRRLSRLTRDLARAAGKQVKFVASGGETELDRRLVEAVTDPLVHMVRNALDHGIEPPNVRKRAGKPAEGRLELKARHLAGHVVIEISDDGAGLDARRIREKAIEAGVVREEQVLTEQESFQLIFHPGLSTAERVTDVSGRGVGMDVVRKNVEAVRGRIDIASAEGVGACFTVRLPLTLAVVEGLAVRVGAERYVIPAANVVRTIRPRVDQVSTVQGRSEVCVVGGEILPLFRLNRLFEIACVRECVTDALAVVVEDGGGRWCLLVDDLLGQHQVLIKPIGDAIGRVPGVFGAAVLDDGDVSLVLDITTLTELARSRACGTATKLIEGGRP